MKLYVTVGLPASGKSTWSKNKARENKNLVIINRDSFRTMLKGDYNMLPFGYSMEKLVTRLERGAIVSAMDYGYDIIIDATNFRLPTNWISDICDKYGYDYELVDFKHVDLKLCIQRDLQRENSVGKEVIERMYNKYIKNDR